MSFCTLVLSLCQCETPERVSDFFFLFFSSGFRNWQAPAYIVTYVVGM
jgi:hypothetical protein